MLNFTSVTTKDLAVTPGIYGAGMALPQSKELEPLFLLYVGCPWEGGMICVRKIFG